jgi:hypothetical protein
MFDTERRLDVLSAVNWPSLARDARPTIETTLRDLLTSCPDLRAVRWVQSLDHPSPDVFIVHDAALEFTDGGRVLTDTGRFDGNAQGDLNPQAYAVLADLILTQTDLLVAAFGLGVEVTATRDGVQVARRTP